ncbi:MAG: DUF1080 domain-containing protein [Planctomycetota bacterium]
MLRFPRRTLGLPRRRMVAVVSTRSVEGLVWAAVLAWAELIGLAIAQPPGVDIDAEAIAPTEKITLYDGKAVDDLAHFYTWLGPQGYDDPNGVFSVAEEIDGHPAIRVTGQDWGGFLTRKNYRDYRLVLEYRWSEKTWNEKARNSGVLFHCQGADGNRSLDFTNTWLSSVEYEIQEGRTGAVILVNGHTQNGTPVHPTIRMRTKHDDIWDPDGEQQEFVGFHFLFQSTYDLGWKNQRGYRGRNDPDKPIGEWNRAEIIAKGGDITYFLNGQKILEATDGSLTEGRIMFQSEGAEIFFRLIELHPLEQR